MARKLSEEVRPPALKKYSETFDEYLQGADRLIGSLLHHHLFTEHLLERLIRTQLQHPDRVIGKLRYYQKLRRAEALDVLPENLAQALGMLNSLRNKVAHEKGYEITRKELEGICMAASDGKRCEDLKVVAQGDRVDFGDAVFGDLFDQLHTHTLEVEARV